MDYTEAQIEGVKNWKDQGGFCIVRAHDGNNLIGGPYYLCRFGGWIIGNDKKPHPVGNPEDEIRDSWQWTGKSWIHRCNWFEGTFRDIRFWDDWKAAAGYR